MRKICKLWGEKNSVLDNGSCFSSLIYYIFILLPSPLKGNSRGVLSSQAFYSVHSVTKPTVYICVILNLSNIVTFSFFLHAGIILCLYGVLSNKILFMNCRELDYRFEIDANIDSSPLVL